MIPNDNFLDAPWPSLDTSSQTSLFVAIICFEHDGPFWFVHVAFLDRSERMRKRSSRPTSHQSGVVLDKMNIAFMVADKIGNEKVKWIKGHHRKITM
jgi:hypothetical protein